MKNVSNFGIRAELGRLPLMLLVAICKYRLRLEIFDDNDLLFHAVQSQRKLTCNSYRSLTYTSFTDKLLRYWNITANQELNPSCNLFKKLLHKLTITIKSKCKQECNNIFIQQLLNINNDD